MKDINVLKEWFDFIEKVDSTLKDNDYFKVYTPKLVASPAMEAYLEGFRIEGTDYFLPTSPEFGLKKLWGQTKDFHKIFEISKSFRAKEEKTNFHQPEFTMLEYYCAEVEVLDFKNEMLNLLKSILNCKTLNFNSVSLTELFYNTTGFELHPDYTSDDFKRVLDFHRLHYESQDSLNDLYQRLYLELLEPSLSTQGLLFVHSYPPFLAALAKTKSDGFADRFEIFFNGIELGNGYNELFSPEAVKKRWEEENQLRRKESQKEHPVDTELLNSLETVQINQGVGVAMGLERLFLAYKKLKGESIESIDFYKSL